MFDKAQVMRIKTPRLSWFIPATNYICELKEMLCKHK